MSTIDVDIECLAEFMPMIDQCCRVVGSERSEQAHTVRLVIEGESVPEGHVTATVHRLSSKIDTTLRIVFEEVK